MAEKVHPHASPQSATKSPPVKSAPPPGTYIIQLPKNQIFRVPPPENALRYALLSRRKTRRSSLRRSLCFLLLLSLLLAASSGALYLAVRPQSPDFTGRITAFSGVDLTSPSPISPAIDVTVRSNNPNGKIGIHYLDDSHVSLYYADVTLCDAVLPVFYQPPRNATEFVTALRGRLELTETVRFGLVEAQARGRVPLRLKIRAPVKLKVGPVDTWRMIVKVECDLTVDKLTAGANIVSKECNYGFHFW